MKKYNWYLLNLEGEWCLTSKPKEPLKEYSFNKSYNKVLLSMDGNYIYKREV